MLSAGKRLPFLGESKTKADPSPALRDRDEMLRGFFSSVFGE